MKFLRFIVIVNILVVIGVIGFVIWQFFDSGSPLGLIILALILVAFLGFFEYIGVPHMLYRGYVKSTGERARAIILERHFGTLEMHTGGDEYGHGGQLTSQQIILKLEVHPNNGATYIVEDRFWANAMDVRRLTPGSEMQVVIARNNPKLVASMPETINTSANASARARLF